MEYYEFSIFCLGLVIAGMVLTEVFNAAKQSTDKPEASSQVTVPLNKIVHTAKKGVSSPRLQPQAVTG